MDADVIVIGGGIMGLWTAYHLSEQNVKTLLLEQFPFPHTWGSSHGQSRLARTLYGDFKYASMMPEAFEKWKLLEEQSGRTVMLNIGVLALYDMNDKNLIQEFEDAKVNMQKFQPDYQIIEGKDISKHFEGMTNCPHHMGIYDRKAGLLKPGACMQSLREYITQNQGQIRDREKVISIQATDDSNVTITTKTQTYHCRSIVVTCGSYTNEILSSVNLSLPLKPMKAAVMYWKDVSKTKIYSIEKEFPAVMMRGSYYTVPSYEHEDLMKICSYAIIEVDPNKRDIQTEEIKKLEEERMESFRKQISHDFPQIDVNGPCISEPAVLTKTPTEDYIIDFHPNHHNIVIGAGFSGHGFKTSPWVGKKLANMATGKVDSPKEFGISRFN